MKWTLRSSSVFCPELQPIYSEAMTSLLSIMLLYFHTELKFTLTPNTFGFMSKSIIRKCSFLPRASYKESIDKLVVLLVSYTEVLWYHYVSLPSAVLLMGQVSADHTCLYKQMIDEIYTLQILWDNMSNGRIKHYSSEMFDITVYGFNVSLCECVEQQGN